MAKTIAALLLCFLALFVGTSPALAARDPFRPLVSQTSAPSTGSTTSTTGSSTSGTSSTTSSSTSSTISQPTDASPNTGFDAAMWMALALALIVVGAGLIIIDRLLRPGLEAGH